MKPSRQSGLPINGLLLLDKPEGITSNRALQQARRLFDARKAGHTGSLDPIATGLLPICFGDATKICGLFLDTDKSYRVRIRLGQVTDTGDREGDIIAESNVDLTDRQIEQAMQRFQGEIDQVPPMYSAIKRNGQPLYKLARKGIEVTRQPRKVTVYNLQWLGRQAHDLEVAISCSKGFYVRAMATDLGAALGCGAHVTQLRRTRVGQFDVAQSITLAQLESLTAGQREQHLLSIEQGLDAYPPIYLPENIAVYFCRGQCVKAASANACGWVRVYTVAAVFLGLGEVGENNTLTPRRVFMRQP